MNNQIQTDAVGLTALVLVAASWLVFGSIFLLRKKSAKVEEAKRAPAAIVGVVMQSLGFAIVGFFRRPLWWPFPASLAGELALAAAVVLLAWASSWLCLRAVQTLGKQWKVRARLIEGHELITEGPYGIVRNPIYLGMFGLMIATGLVLAIWWALLGAVVVFIVGTQIRISAEERLLREAFGAKFTDYTQRVRAFLPGIW